MIDEKILVWHFLKSGGITGHGNMQVVPGQVLSLPDEQTPELCLRGFHGSERAIDALSFAPGLWVQRAWLWDDVSRAGNKDVGRHRECLWLADATRIVQLFAIDEAERALALIDNPDERSVNALVAARQYLDGNIGIDELRDAVRDAYADADARDAAARDAAARAAAYAADAAYAAYAAADADAAAADAAARAADAAARAAAVRAADAAYAAYAAADAAARAAAAAAAVRADYASSRSEQNARLEAALMALQS